MTTPLPAPAHLSDAAKAVWAEVVLPHHTARVALVLEALCTQVARMRDAQGRIDSEGLIVAGPKGLPAPHPALAIERAAAGEVAKLRGEVAKLRGEVAKLRGVR